MSSLKLADWANQKNIKYATAYSWYKKGLIEEPTYKNEGGGIMVGARNQSQNIAVANNAPLVAHNATTPPPNASSAAYSPVGVEYEDHKIAKKYSSAQSTRSNRAADIQPLDRFANINQVFLPFRYSYNGQNTNCNLNIREVLLLTQKAYFGYSIVRSLIETLTLFSSSKIYFQGGNKKSRDFFKAYFKSIKLEKFQEQFFREFWRSGNVFVWRLNGNIKDRDIKKLIQVYGLEISEAATVKVPILYSVLNPVDIEIRGGASFINPFYYKVVQDYELDRLRSPQNDQDRAILESLPDEVRAQIKSKTNMVLLPLNEDNICAVFNGKQDYESFAVPIVYSVLDSLEHKTQLLKMDRAIAKTAQQAVLLVTMGYEGKDGSYNFNQNAANALQSLFANESTFKAIVCDFTTKMEFILPQIGEILDPRKYEIVQQDLQEGLGHILFTGSGGDKFSNLSTKVKIFIEKIRSARETFLNEFLNDEIKRISQAMNFKVYPTPVFEDIDIDDSNEFKRIVNQLANMGFLTPEETFEAIQSKRLPNSEESVESQEKFKALREKGLYTPPNSVPQDGSISGGGRPAGTKAPQTKKDVSPIGTASNELFSLTKIKDNLSLSFKLEESLEKLIKEKYKVKEFTPEQASIKNELLNNILVSNPPSEWTIETAKKQISEKRMANKEAWDKIKTIQENYQVDSRMASILNASIKES